MHKILSFIKTKYALMAILMVAVLSMGFLGVNQQARSANCPQLAPTHPQFDVFPINYDPSTICTDAAQIDAFTIGAAGRDGRFAQSQTEHDAGVTANAGDEVWVSVYFHNGASDQIDRAFTTAHNTVVAANLNGGTATAHAISSQISASNAATVTSATRGGAIVVKTSQPTTLSYIPGSSSLCITLQHATELVGAVAANALANCGTSNKVLPIGDGVASGGFNLGDLKACFPYSGTLDFKVRVNGNVTPPPAAGKLSISKLVENQTQNQTSFANSTSARQGDIVSYQVTVTNTGSANVANVTVTDPGAAGLVSAAGTVFPNHASLGTLAAGQHASLVYAAQVTAASGTIVNTATASGTGVASVSDSATVNVNTPAPQVGNLSITKQVQNLSTGSALASSTTARQGDTVQYQIVVTNTGNGNVDNVVVNDPGVAGISANFPSNVSLGTLVPGQTRTSIFTGTVTASSGTLTNSVTATATGVTQVTASATVVVNTPAPQVGNLSITKQVQNLSTNSGFANTTSARQGDTVQYQIVVTNTGNGNVNNVVLNDPGIGGISGSFPSNVNFGTLTPGQSRTTTFTATVTASSGSLTNTATASGTNVSSVSASATVFISTPQPQNSTMSITKGVADFTRGNVGFAPSVNAFNGDTVGFQIVLTNTGNATINNVSLVDNLPSGLNFVPGSLSVSTLSGGIINSNFSNITIPTLNPGQSVTETLSAVVNQIGTLTNTATASAPNANTVSASATVFVQNNVIPGNLVISKLVKNLSQGNSFFSKSVTANPGDRIAFQITVAAQNADANNVTVFDSLPQFFNFASGSARLNNGFLADSLVQGGANIGFIGNGQTETITFEGNVSNSVPNGQNVLTNTASASANNAGTVTDSATIVLNNNVPQFSQLSINKLVRNISFQNVLQKNISAFPNDRVAFQITVTNTGSTTVNNVTLRDTLPGGFSYAGGTTRLDGNQVNDITSGFISLGSMFPGQQRTVTFEGNVNAPVNSTIQNTAFAQGDNAAQVQDTASIVINNPVAGANINLTQSKRAFNDTRNADATLVTAQKEDFITYTLTVVNSGNAPANNFVISDDLSGVLSLSSLVNNGGGTLNGNVLSWPAVTIPANGSVSETFRVRINFFLPNNANLTLTNTFGNTVVIHVGQVLGQTFVAPKTGSSMEVALGFGAMITAGFAMFRKKNFLGRMLSALPKIKLQ